MVRHVSDRAIGQYFRNLKLDSGWEMLALKALNNANRDARNCMPVDKPNRRFQPGVSTPPEELAIERQRLLDWVKSDQFRLWNEYFRRDPDDARATIEKILNG